MSRKARNLHRRKFLALALGLAAHAAGADELPAKQKFVMDLQRAIRTDDKAWLAGHMAYPVRFYGRREMRIGGKASFIKNYGAFIGTKLRAAVLAQDAGNVFENWQGLMVGEGSYNIWVRNSGEGTDVRYEIVTINDSE